MSGEKSLKKWENIGIVSDGNGIWRMTGFVSAVLAQIGLAICRSRTVSGTISEAMRLVSVLHL